MDKLKVNTSYIKKKKFVNKEPIIRLETNSKDIITGLLYF
jgi:hypothetical protein